MSNIKSWGDVSSDDDSDDDRPSLARVPPRPVVSDEYAGGEEEDGDDGGEYSAEPIIEGPPFTAFLGNLSYDIRSSNDLSREIENLLREKRLESTTRVSAARLTMDRSSGQSKGFGYVEFDTGDEVRCLSLLTLF
jgi:hypothetical protein